MINWYRAGRKSQQELQHPEPIHIPVLMLWGKGDRFLNAEMATESIALCPAGQLHYLDNATHWLHHEEPATVNQFISEFLIKTGVMPAKSAY
jgi:epoxide hydrolase 4